MELVLELIKNPLKYQYKHKNGKFRFEKKNKIRLLSVQNRIVLKKKFYKFNYLNYLN